LFSLAWLHEFAKSPNVRNTTKVSVSREESLQYLKQKTKETNIPSLLGTVNLMEALQLIQNVIVLKSEMLIIQGGNLVPVFEDLLQASHINMVYHLLQAVGRQMLFQAGLWTYLGIRFSRVH
jgi:anaphase-promoting complex subunit 5